MSKESVFLIKIIMINIFPSQNQLAYDDIYSGNFHEFIETRAPLDTS